MCCLPPIPRRYDAPLPLSTRFQNVSADRGVADRTRIQLCGRLSVEVDGAQLADGLRGKQVPLLLAYLVLNRARHVGREELIGALWPQRAPQSQDGALRTLLSRLRSGLGDGNALSGRDELILSLPEPVWVDVEAAGVEIERAQQALAGRDPRTAWALAQVPLNIARRGLLPGSAAPWLEPRRRELEEVRLAALEVVGRAGLELGGSQLASAQRAARSLIESEPYRESGYVLLMEALAAEGNVAEALRVFEQLRTLLRDELGTAPSPDAIAVHERLLRPRGREEPGDGAHAPAGPQLELPPELQARAAQPLVGRGPELEQLGSLWSAAAQAAARRAGGERLVLIAGDPGIGKTSLMAHLAHMAHEHGAVVLAGRSPQENVVPYQPFLEALRHYVTRIPFAQLRATAREYGAELARLIPELRRRAPELAPAALTDPETERYRLFEAVVGLLSEISVGAPVLLVLDDLQWADKPTLLLLRHLARAPEPARMLILGTYRSTEAESFTEALLDLRRERLVTQLDLHGLSEPDTGRLVELRTGTVPSAALRRALYQETEGNPFFIEEIVRHLAEAGIAIEGAGASVLQRVAVPEGVRDVIARRLARLDSQALACLRVAAVIGRDFDATLLERITSLDEEEFLSALDAALEAGLITESPAMPGRYSFAHALIRETLYEGMSSPRRTRIHRRVGEALEQAGDGHHLTALARHFTRAAGPQDAEKAIRYAVDAGAQASEMLAHEEAAEHYARALEVQRRFAPGDRQRRCELLLALGEARTLAGERQPALEALREAAAIASELGDGASLARAAIGASQRYIQQPGVVDEELIELLQRALELTAGEHTLRRVQLLARLCGALYYSPQRDRMRALSAEATELAAALDDAEALAYAAAARRRALWDPVHLKQRLEASTELLTEARRAGNPELELQGHAWLVVDLLELGDRGGVEAQIDAFTAGAQRLGQPLYLWNATVWRAMRALLAGSLAHADELSAQALATGASAEALTAGQYYAVQLLAIRREQLRIGELEQAARELVAANPARPAWRAALATLLLESGRRDEARQEFERLAAGGLEDIPQDGDWMIAMTLLSDVCAGLGDAERAALLHDRLAAYREMNVVIGLAAACLGSAARYLGKLAATTGREEQAAAHFELALEANGRLNAPVLLAHTQLDYALALGNGRRRTELIEAAANTAQMLDLPWVAERALQLRAH